MNAAAALEGGGLAAIGLLLLKVLGWTAAVIVLAIFGWSISSLHVLAGWDGGGLAVRLEIIRGILASVGAGAVAALAGYYYELPIVLICLAVFLAGMSGERFLKPMAERFLGRLMAAFDGFFGKNGNGNGSGNGPRPPK